MPVPYNTEEPAPQTAVLTPAADVHTWQVQHYALDQAQWRHDDVLYRWGEWAAFILKWSPRDHAAGLVERCPTCFVAGGEIAEAYGQVPQARCPDCYGTTFEGGYRALIIRPSLWDHSADEEEHKKRGSVLTARAAIQSTSDFYMHPSDWVMRADGTRWQTRSVATQHYHTGMGTPSDALTRLAGVFGECDRVTEESPAYLIRPELPAALGVAVASPFPMDWTGYEDIRGPLLVPYDPADFTPADD